MKMEAYSTVARSPEEQRRPAASDVVCPDGNEVLTSQGALANNCNTSLLKNSKLLRKLARYYVTIGKPQYGRQLLEAAIQNGGWHKAGLWYDLVAAMSHSGDYQSIRSLWLRTPVKCHNNVSVLRAVARAACVSGEHGDSRALLRRAALATSSEVNGRGTTSRFKASISRRLFRMGEPSDGAQDGSFSRAAGEALLDLHRAFSGLGPKAFLISGTLLGLVRERRIIGWDKDIDVGVFSEDCPPDMEEFFRRHERFHLGRVDLSTDRLRVIHANGTWIDIFPHYMEGDRLWHDGSATRWWNTPFTLKTIDFLGVEQFVPGNPELYLEENYGDWRTPVESFDARLDAPNVQITDQEHFITLLFFSLDNSIRKNDITMKQRYIQLLREAGEGAWLERL